MQDSSIRPSASLGMTLFFLISCFVSSVYALEVPAKPQGYVNDYAGLLSEGARRELEETLTEFERTTSNQVVVATFPSLEGGSLEDFSIRLAQAWKIGTAKKDNGVILLIFRDDRQVRIEVGYGLEGALPDATADLIIREEIVPAFRAGDYDRGIREAVSAIIEATRGEYKAVGLPSEGFENKITAYILFALVFILVLVLLIARKGEQTISGRRGTWNGRGFYGGGGSGGRSFSGGGGSFGGGGASGRW